MYADEHPYACAVADVLACKFAMKWFWWAYPRRLKVFCFLNADLKG